MRDEIGISIILADSKEEVDRLVEVLGIEKAINFLDIRSVGDIDFDSVYYAIERRKDAMEKFASCIRIRRGVMSYQGKRDLMGFNRDWMTKIIAQPRAQVKKVLSESMPAGFGRVFENLHEKDDPHLDLGYRR